jgi:ligand-binding sensor domain-containing protein
VKWFGTANRGISSFDRDRWQTWTTMHGLIDERILSLALERDNTLWVGTPRGVSSFNGVIWQSWPIPLGRQ